MSESGIYLRDHAVLSSLTLEVMTSNSHAALTFDVSTEGAKAENIQAYCNYANHGGAVLGTSNKLENVVFFESKYHGIAVKGMGHELLECQAVGTNLYNGLIVKADETRTESNATYSIYVKGGAYGGEGNGIQFQSFHENSKVYNIILENVTVQRGRNTVQMYSRFESGIISNIYSDILVDASGLYKRSVLGVLTNDYVSISEDYDRDTIPDEWELRFTNRIDVINGADDWDSDKDGVSDLNEYFTNTNPLDESELLILSCEPVNDGESVHVSWIAKQDREYMLESTKSLHQVWKGVYSYQSNTNSFTDFYDMSTLSTNVGSRFYRIVVSPLIPFSD